MADEEPWFWVKAFGGVGNASTVRLRIGEDHLEAPLAPSRSQSAFLVVAIDVAGGARPWRHAALGARVGSTGPKPLRSTSERGYVGVSGGKFEVCVEGLPTSRLQQMACEVFELSPVDDELRGYHTIITVVFYLGHRDSGFEQAMRDTTTLGSGCSFACDELGVVLLDTSRVRELIAEAGEPDPDDLIAFLGSSDAADGLVAEGALVPVWGMRPWLYRVAVQGGSPARAALGVRVGEVKRYSTPSKSCRLTIAPGRALRSWRDFDPSDWPSATLPSGSAAFEIELRTIVGYEPIAPEFEVGVLPTIVVRGRDVATDGTWSILDGLDPFAPPRRSATPEDCLL